MSRLDYLKQIKLREISYERIIFAIKVRLKDLPHRLICNLNLGIAKENNNRIIKDASVNGKLDIFEKVECSNLFLG